MPESNVDLTGLLPSLTELARQGQTALLPALYTVQEACGYIPGDAIQAIAQQFGLTENDIIQVIEFYPMFYRQPVAKTVVHVCNNPVCANAGAEAVMKRLSQTLETHRLAGQPVGALTLEYAPCLGLCEHAPAMIIQGASVARADALSYEDLVAGKLSHPRSIVRNEIAILTANCGKNRVNWLNLYQASGGYTALRQALARPPAELIETVKAAGLRGRGGAAFSTGAKWENAAQAPGAAKYVVCNADEAEPGAFKDRVLLEDEPHLVLEGLILAGYAIGARKGYVYVRGEYIFQYRVMQRAVEEAYQAGLLGENVLNSGFHFDVEVRRGAGTYVAGEETAQLESIEGKPAIPRSRPPFPATHGLFGSPTVVNNVETLANVPYIVRAGAAEYRKIGTAQSSGPKLFCLSGDVTLPGLYEVPFGVTFRHLLEDLAGGVRGGRKMQAALFGGAAGTFASPEQLDVPLTIEDLQANGLALGSGVITVFDDTRDLHDILLRLSRFFAEESCGKCQGCSTGTARQYEIIQRWAAGGTEPGDREALQDTAWTQADVSTCGVGQLAAAPILSAMQRWPGLFD